MLDYHNQQIFIGVLRDSNLRVCLFLTVAVPVPVLRSHTIIDGHSLYVRSLYKCQHVDPSLEPLISYLIFTIIEDYIRLVYHTAVEPWGIWVIIHQT